MRGGTQGDTWAVVVTRGVTPTPGEFLSFQSLWTVPVPGRKLEIFDFHLGIESGHGGEDVIAVRNRIFISIVRMYLMTNDGKLRFFVWLPIRFPQAMKRRLCFVFSNSSKVTIEFP